MCLALLLCEQFCRFANGGAKISIKSYFMRSFFCFSVFSSSEVLGKITSIQSKLPTAACGLWKKREETVKPTCFGLLYVESDKSFRQYSLPVEALNLIVDSKSQPFELDNSTRLELHVTSRRKKKFAIIMFCGF